MIKKDRLIRTLQALIKIDSQNPSGTEQEIARWVHGYLRRIGIASRLRSFAPGRPNVIARIAGRAPADNRRSLLITPHLDTVPAGPGWRRDPFSGQVCGDRIYGLGATDCKGNLAVALETVHSLREERAALDYDLVFAATADEESGSGCGLKPLIRSGMLRVDAALVLDADDFEIIITQKGLMHVTVTIEGKKAHGAYPWRGINAIDQTLAVLSDMKVYMERLSRSSGRNKYLRPPTMNIGTISGGDKVNVVAGSCAVELDFRFLPGMDPRRIIAALRTAAERHCRRYTVRIDDLQKPYCIPQTHPLAAGLAKAMADAGARPRISGSEGATVITFFQDQGIPAIATGFGCLGTAHMADEYARISRLCKGAAVLERFLARYKFC
ncbi:MAG TPA: M20 family metallopeptidase [Candidatus Omnitrophota bacterium]|nr:M20 family metallopeptidase [Candidatus Omnitrophota bacterium]HNQ50064.1 M20 family metallopeptidase [Candidatus Omnitrophota bacterium]